MSLGHCLLSGGFFGACHGCPASVIGSGTYLTVSPCSRAARPVNRLRWRPGGVVRQEVGGRALSGEGGWASASVLGWHEVILPFWPGAGLPLLGGRF